MLFSFFGNRKRAFVKDGSPDIVTEKLMVAFDDLSARLWDSANPKRWFT